jgi:hypothetical protein
MGGVAKLLMIADYRDLKCWAETEESAGDVSSKRGPGRRR